MASVNRPTTMVGASSFLRVSPTNHGAKLTIHDCTYPYEGDLEFDLSPTERQDLIYALSTCKPKTFALEGEKAHGDDIGPS